MAALYVSLLSICPSLSLSNPVSLFVCLSVHSVVYRAEQNFTEKSNFTTSSNFIKVLVAVCIANKAIFRSEVKPLKGWMQDIWRPILC